MSSIFSFLSSPPLHPSLLSVFINSILLCCLLFPLSISLLSSLRSNPHLAKFVILFRPFSSVSPYLFIHLFIILLFDSRLTSSLLLHLHLIFLPYLFSSFYYPLLISDLLNSSSLISLSFFLPFSAFTAFSRLISSVFSSHINFFYFCLSFLISSRFHVQFKVFSYGFSHQISFSFFSTLFLLSILRLSFLSLRLMAKVKVIYVYLHLLSVILCSVGLNRIFSFSLLASVSISFRNWH